MNSTNDVETRKTALRHQVWHDLVAQQASPGDVAGTIPMFTGAEAAAERLAGLPVWRQAGVVKANPDKAQLPVRARALADGKHLFMAVPGMANVKPFFRLDPATARSATKEWARAHTPVVGPDEIPHVDVVVCGSVAVSTNGARIGKGAGFSDLEIALLIAAGVVTDTTTIVATVHDVQVVDEAAIPVAGHDVFVDLIVTPTRVIECPAHARPTGIDWAHLPADKRQSIPILQAHPQP